MEIVTQGGVQAYLAVHALNKGSDVGRSASGEEERGQKHLGYVVCDFGMVQNCSEYNDLAQHSGT